MGNNGLYQKVKDLELLDKCIAYTNTEKMKWAWTEHLLVQIQGNNQDPGSKGRVCAL